MNKRNDSRYKIESTGNGFSYTITRLADGKSAYIQGADAVDFARYLEQTTDKFTDDDLCSEYDDVME